MRKRLAISIQSTLTCMDSLNEKSVFACAVLPKSYDENEYEVVMFCRNPADDRIIKLVALAEAMSACCFEFVCQMTTFSSYPQFPEERNAVKLW